MELGGVGGRVLASSKRGPGCSRINQTNKFSFTCLNILTLIFSPNSSHSISPLLSFLKKYNQSSPTVLLGYGSGLPASHSVQQPM